MREPRVAVLLVALAALVATAAGCVGPLSEPATPTPEPTQPASPSQPPLRFLAVGDMGTGDAMQRQVAEAMARVCAERGCEFVLGLGDLIYPAGPGSPDDPQFDAKFEQPYAGLDLPFWMALGNHDNGGDPDHLAESGALEWWHEPGDHAVAYSHRTDRPSDNWHLPARHYGFSAGDVDFLALDTTALLFGGVDGLPDDLNATVHAQEAWLAEAVAAGNGSWTIAFGHHPYVSNGPHGNAGAYDGRPTPGFGGDHLKEVFERELCGKADLYLAGHDHNLQWLEPVPSCGDTHFIVSGGGGAHTYPIEGNASALFQQEAHGFWWFEVREGELLAAAYDEDAFLLFQRSIPKPVTQLPNGS